MVGYDGTYETVPAERWVPQLDVRKQGGSHTPRLGDSWTPAKARRDAVPPDGWHGMAVTVQNNVSRAFCLWGM